ncbi:hypothetical protein KIN20_033628 [Parelaphostrongylus tenuis]|uniref:riboflavin kinase n=1 Tax=Parelaphostrongylus tenuis TaxID=148309 RepID=A0AAD5R8X9_PARTN|nr:hypothetical protein KIN20_033628 [Parelaphostrongylus tenuis]
MHIDHLFPYFLRGRVVTGFGRGGKELGCPTANIEDSVVESLPSELPCGVFYGIARINGEESLLFTTRVWFEMQPQRTEIEAKIVTSGGLPIACELMIPTSSHYG